MKKCFASLLAALLLLSLLPPAQATIGRDILLVSRQFSNWTRQDEAVILDAEGRRWLFDLSALPREVRNDPAELLFFLRVHGLSKDAVMHGAPMPTEMTPLDAEAAGQIRSLLAQIEDAAFESKFYAFDAGGTFLYGVQMLNGEAVMTLLAESGTNIGQSQDPAAQEILALTASYLMME